MDFRFIILILSHALVAFIFMNLSLMPPTMVPIRNAVLNINPIARAIYIEQLSTSAYRGLIVKAAIELGIFEILSSGSDCMFIEQIQQKQQILLAKRGTKTNSVKKSFIPTTTTSSTSASSSSLEELEEILEALSSMSLVESCGSMTTTSTSSYSLTTVSKIHLNSVGRGSVRRNDGRIILDEIHEEKNQDWSGMILTANSPAVIKSLLALSEKMTLIETTTNNNNNKKEIMSISYQEETNLWKEFAENTHEIFIETAKLSARALLERFSDDLLVTSSVADQTSENINSLHYFDIGAGSGVVSETFCRGCSYNLKNRENYILVDLPDVIDHLESQGIRKTFCGDRNEHEFENNVVSVHLVKANATAGDEFSKTMKESISKQLMNFGLNNNDHHHRRRMSSSSSTSTTTLIFSLNSFLQHFDDETCEDILTRLLNAASEEMSKMKESDGNNNKRQQIIFSIMELENPSTSFNPWTEWLPSGRIFSLVLRAFTSSGRVRTEGSYAKMLEKVAARRNNNDNYSNSVLECEVEAVRKELFPLPAGVSTIRCVVV